MIEWLAFFGATESNGGDPDIIFQGKDERSAGNERMGKNLLYILIVYALGGPSGGIILTSSHIETDKDGVEYDGAYGVVSALIR
ncbi:hypothetical protein H7T43_25195 [Peribacillus simplex]|uniref:hypothetical protein n=1 Tax=Peribacillus TaxID=2675229 RepID=UPI002162F846|nr:MULTISPECIES: hypothetical protein [Peribacillus]MBX9958145.1 hypothetical protein [Peribacillus simplex]